MKNDNFVNIKLTENNLDRFYIRTSILKEIESSLHFFHGNLLDVGCGKMPYRDFILCGSNVKKYVGLDIEGGLLYDPETTPDIFWNGLNMPFNDESFDTALATEVLEHCPEPQTTLNETFRVLKKGGCFFFTVPFVWPLHEVPHDEFRYTPYSLSRMLTNAGFTGMQIRPTGGWHASMAQMLGLWVRRAPMPNTRRSLYSKFLMPVIKYLIKIDSFSKAEFQESQMVTGLAGIAFKN